MPRTCAWCGGVWLERWLTRDEAIGLVGRKAVERADSHGICETCLRAELELLAASRRAA